MFHFGSEEDSASLYYNLATSKTGPAFPTGPLDELSVDELKIVLTYRRMAYKEAVKDLASPKLLDLLLASHDEAFECLALASERFRTIVDTGRHQPITGFGAESVNKYRKLAGLPPKEDIVYS